MKEQNILFKGTKDGVTVVVNDDTDYELIKKAIDSKVRISKNFFKNGRLFIDFSNTHIDKIVQNKIQEQIFDDFQITMEKVEKTKGRMFTGIYEGKTKFLSGTIRSGQHIEYEGNIVVIGDINAGGQITAEGNIIVLGSLRGVVHAGSSGNTKAVVAAFSLQPTQLRIADVFSRAPDGKAQKPKCPELARVKDGCIVIEPYAPNKFFD
ncbi:MAG TPA: septum site-determining protein MinC [Clostridiaceae bacterium]|nr:septum site-determining protein MinC [Clostridiaceae bacterium]